jgi:hypothetical protein
MRRSALVLALCAGLGTGVAACGGGNDDATDIVPKSVPDITVSDTSLPNAPARSSTTSTTDTTDTTSTTDTTAGAAAPAQTPAPAPSTPQTGGTPATGTTTSGANSGGFSDFCQQNPGACPGE